MVALLDEIYKIEDLYQNGTVPEFAESIARMREIVWEEIRSRIDAADAAQQ